MYAHIERRCVAERWTDVNGELLTPERVTLYDANRYVILPATEKLGCSFVELVASGPQKPTWFVSHWWGEPIVLFLRCIETHAEDHGLDEDAPFLNDDVPIVDEDVGRSEPQRAASPERPARPRRCWPLLALGLVGNGRWQLSEGIWMRLRMSESV